MAQPQPAADAEKEAGGHHTRHLGLGTRLTSKLGQLEKNECRSSPFIGRLGGNQVNALDRHDERNQKTLQQVPDAAPYMALRQQFDLRPFATIGLWKAAFIEGFGTFMIVFVTIYASISPEIIPAPFTVQFGPFNNASFLGPLIGGITNFIIITIVIFGFGSVSGAHFNPTITFATFCARLCSFARMILYIGFQVAGSALAGLLIRAVWGGRNFKTGGCWLYTDVVPVSSAWVVEFMFTLLAIAFAFGVGLDPRQASTVGPKLSPFLVGLGVGVLNFSSGFSIYGYGGASVNPARCFGAFVGSRFPGWHWIHWVADGAACIFHGFVYFVNPPWETNARD